LLPLAEHEASTRCRSLVLLALNKLDSQYLPVLRPLHRYIGVGLDWETRKEKEKAGAVTWKQLGAAV
jgi:hypothetical protein